MAGSSGGSIDLSGKEAHLERIQRARSVHENTQEFLQRSRDYGSSLDDDVLGMSASPASDYPPNVHSRSLSIDNMKSFEFENTTLGALRRHAAHQPAASLPNFTGGSDLMGAGITTPPLSTGDLDFHEAGMQNREEEMLGIFENLENLNQSTNFTTGDMEIAKEMVTNYFEELQELDHALERQRLEYKLMDDQRRQLEAKLQEAIEERDKAQKDATNETTQLKEAMRNKKEELETNALRAEVEQLQKQISGIHVERKRASKSDEAKVYHSGSDSDEESDEEPTPREKAKSSSPAQQYNFMEIDFESLVLAQRIGVGTFGEVYKATWNNTDVAVKKLLVQDMKAEHLEDFRSEVEILSKLRHPNVVLFMGACTKHPNFSIITEFCPRGSLFHVLHYSNAKIDHKRRLRIALDTALGLNYLHNLKPMLVHRDIKSPNLLVDKNWNVKVGDFGLSRVKRHMYLSTNSCAGTPNWMAPEVLRGENYNEKADIYSFGVVLWELFVRQVPFGGLNPMQVASIVGHQNRRMLIPSTCDTEYAELIRRCWHSDPTKRPALDEVIGIIRRHLDLLERTSSK